MGMKLGSGKFKPGDHVFVMVPMTNDLIEGHIMFENVDGYLVKPIRSLSQWPDERHSWNHSPSHSHYSQIGGDRVDCSENLILPYGLGAIVLFTSKGGRIR